MPTSQKRKAHSHESQTDALYVPEPEVDEPSNPDDEGEVDSSDEEFFLPPEEEEEAPSLNEDGALADLAHDIGVAHAACLHQGQRTIKLAVRVGELLLDAKSRVGRHGMWMDWLSANVDFSYETATRYMKL